MNLGPRLPIINRYGLVLVSPKIIEKMVSCGLPFIGSKEEFPLFFQQVGHSVYFWNQWCIWEGFLLHNPEGMDQNVEIDYAAQTPFNREGTPI